MGIGAIPFIFAEPEVTWFEDIIFEVLYNFPVELFGEIRQWMPVVTQNPFIKEFEVCAAKKLVAEVRSRIAISEKELIQTKDEPDSDLNFKQFLMREPFRMLIMGDISRSFFEIGEVVCKFFGTQHVTPTELVKQQIIQNTPIGKWLFWNLKKGNGVPIWIVFKLLELELKSDNCTQKGFILTGFPINPNLTTRVGAPCVFKEDEDYGEHHENYRTDMPMDEGYTIEGREDTASQCSSSSIMSSSIENQEEMLSVLRNIEFVLLDGDEELILKHCVRKQMDFFYKLWCRPNYIVYIDPSQRPFTKTFLATVDILQYFFLHYTKMTTVRIDSRIGFQAICNRICNRFEFINYKVNYECCYLNTYGSINMTLEQLMKIGNILPNYHWWISQFNRVCPVTLHHGRRRYCDSKFPVRFLRYVFLCHTSKNRKAFAVNPGKYINFLPRCRVAVIGPHRVGKTTLSEYLAYYFKADIYRAHIDTSKKNINNTNKDVIKDKTLRKELKDLDTNRLQEFGIFKQKKTEEWTTCVITLVNDLFKAVKKGKKQPSFDFFNSKNADKYFQSIYKREVSDKGLKKLILENAIFQKSIESFSPIDFLDWVSIKPNLPLLYRQYVLDSAPLDIIFWEELLANDELPDCVFFLGISSIKKMFDIYSLAHDKNCIDDELIFRNICSKFSDWKHFFEPKLQMQVESASQKIASEFMKHLVGSRYKEAKEFIQNYNQLQSFFEDHNVICINIDVSKQTWAQSILKSFVEYLSVYQYKATPLYGAQLQSTYSLFNHEMEEMDGSLSSSLFFSKEKMTESNVSFETSYNYGNCLDWCPVILYNDNILLKGDMRYAAQYKNKTFVMHSRDALIKFVSNPQKYSQKKPVIPPARVYIVGLLHKIKNCFAESLAYSLNVKHVKHFVAITNGDFSVELVRHNYEISKQSFFEDLSDDYETGAVIYGFPLLLDQFNDAIAHKLYPEHVFIFDDQEEIMQGLYRFWSKSNNLNRVPIRYSSIYPQTIPDHKYSRNDILEKCKQIITPFRKEIDKIERACQKLHIPVIKVRKNFKHLDSLLDHYVDKINYFRERRAMFEIVQEITMKESELLLNSGYYRYSRFKRSCPVHVAQLITLNHYKGMHEQGLVYPCIHGDFIYFICGKQNLKDFKKNPLNFINTCNPPQSPNHMSVAVYGPPKSGVTTICHELSKELGLTIFSPNDIAEGPITDSAAIDFLKINRLVNHSGIILDNIPLTPTFLEEAAKNTVDVTAIFVIVASLKTILENWYRQNQQVKNCPSLSIPELLQNYHKSLKSIIELQKSTIISLLNVHFLDGDTNSWTTWNKIKHILIKTTRGIIGYRIKILKHCLANIGNLNLFYDALIFKRDINYFYCQVCLSMGKLNASQYFYVNVSEEFYSDECQKLYNQPYAYLKDEIYTKFNFTSSFDLYEDIEPLYSQKQYKTCLLQYSNIFYWSCNDHIVHFLLYSQQYYNEREQLKPKYIPFLVIGYTKQYVAFEGFCPVEYERGELVKGNMDFSVYYRRKVYIISNKQNTMKFLSYPEKYRKINFDTRKIKESKESTPFGRLSEDKITNTLVDLTISRPKHFSLGAKESATTFLALKLKFQNCDDKSCDYWRAAFRNFVKDCKILAEELRAYQDHINPFITN